MRISVTMVMVLSLYLGACASPQPRYFISIDSPSGGAAATLNPSLAHDSSNSSSCTLTVRLDEIVRDAVSTQPSAGNDWNIRKLRIAFERALDDKIPRECQPRPSDLSKKWLRIYSLGATDPDQDLERLKEYLTSMELVWELTKNQPVTADGTDKQSQWCGNPDANDCKNQAHQLYKVFADTPDQPIESVLLKRIEEITAQNDRYARFLVLTYDIPWDPEQLVRYGITFYFEDRLNLRKKDKDKRGQKTRFVGYTLLYANEATPKPRENEKKTQVPMDCTRDPELKWWLKGWYATGYPFALAIGLKNAAFEIAKVPFSPIAGLLFGRGSPIDYPLENLRNAWDALEVETTHLPRYSLLSGPYNFLTETPLVGYLAQFNTGPEHPEPDLDASPDVVRRKIFLSRGIYGGNKWGQDTGLWTSFARLAYPESEYDVYSPPYRHGTVIDVVWSMFNLSHGPGYSEAKYVMDQNVGLRDHLYLAGHSGGVQRSASASRILVQHGYTVVKVLGIAGPSIGQAYVDTRYPNSFRILLNTETGTNQDVVSRVGVVANVFSTLLDSTVPGPPKYTLGGLAGLSPRHGEELKQEVYAFVDRLGYSNATPVQVDRKPSTKHNTPLRLSLAEPIVFDAYVRSEFASAFREDLERPDRIRLHPLTLSRLAGNDDSCQLTKQNGKDDAFRWSR